MALDPINVYLFTARGPRVARTDRQAVGIGACVLDGATTRLFRGYGYASDAEFPRAFAVHHLLEHFPERRLRVSTEGLQFRLGQFQRGGGKTAKGVPFVGSEHLAALLKATPRLTICKVASGLIPDYVIAKQAARVALEEVGDQPQSKSYVPVIFDSNHILDFREVSS
jgi:hypothetical protein